MRDRDYFFVASFAVWGVWVAVGLADLVRRGMPRVRPRFRGVMLAPFAVAVVPLVLNFSSATRRQTPDATFARDYADALLESVPPGGVLFTWGDNDTFPLWYAQAVEGVRRDVTVVCLALAQTPWYISELRRALPVATDTAALPPVWRGRPVPRVTWPLHDLTDSAVAAFHPFRTDRDLHLSLPNGDTLTVPAGTALYAQDLLLFHVLTQNAGRRPVAWSVTAADALFGLGPHLVQQGMALVMPYGRIDPAHLAGTGAGTLGPGGTPLDLATTTALAEQTWHYGAMIEGDVRHIDPDVLWMAGTMATPITQAGIAWALRGDTTRAVSLLHRAVQLSADSAAAAMLAAIDARRQQGH